MSPFFYFSHFGVSLNEGAILTFPSPTYSPDRNHRPDTTSNHHLLFPSFSNWFGSFYSPCITNIYILLTITTYSFMTDPYQMFGATSSRLASSGMNFEWFVDWKQVKVKVKTIVMDRFGTDPAVAVPTWAAVRLVERGLHHLGGHQRRVQTDRSRRSGQTLGRTQIQTQHELRQTQPGSTVCTHPPFPLSISPCTHIDYTRYR